MDAVTSINQLQVRVQNALGRTGIPSGGGQDVVCTQHDDVTLCLLKGTPLFNTALVRALDFRLSFSWCVQYIDDSVSIHDAGVFFMVLLLKEVLHSTE
jgi:hypoxanthine-guanine phosphoribosyltransferase